MPSDSTGMMLPATAALFADDTPGDVDTIRQTLQSDYVRRLADILDRAVTPEHDTVARAMAMQQLEAIRWRQSRLSQRSEHHEEERKCEGETEYASHYGARPTSHEAFLSSIKTLIRISPSQLP